MMTTSERPTPFEKVSVFVVRYDNSNVRLLVFDHPLAGRQIPAGSVEPGETYTDAALREVCEETGLHLSGPIVLLRKTVADLHSSGILIEHSPIFTDASLRERATGSLKRGHKVRVLRKTEDSALVEQQIFDLNKDPPVILSSIKGWIQSRLLAEQEARYFVATLFQDHTPESWTNEADGHTFLLSWADLAGDHCLVAKQQEWLHHSKSALIEFLKLTSGMYDNG